MSAKRQNLLRRSWRLLKIAKRPNRQEIWLVIKVTAVGMILMGLVGFLVRQVANVAITILEAGFG